MNKLLSSKKGFGIGSAILALGVGLLAFTVISDRTSFLMKASSFDEQMQALIAIKRTIKNSIDCMQTLDIKWDGKSKPGPPLCIGNMTIKNIAGDPLNFGDFDIKAKCEGNELKIKIISGPPIQTNKKLKWSQTKEGKDLIPDTKLCGSFLPGSGVPHTFEIGGIFMVNNLWKGTSKYGRHKNKVTDDYNCPEEFGKRAIYEFDNTGCGDDKKPGYYLDDVNDQSKSKKPNCSVIQYVCYRWK